MGARARVVVSTLAAAHVPSVSHDHHHWHSLCRSSTRRARTSTCAECAAHKRRCAATPAPAAPLVQQRERCPWLPPSFLRDHHDPPPLTAFWRVAPACRLTAELNAQWPAMASFSSWPPLSFGRSRVRAAVGVRALPALPPPCCQCRLPVPRPFCQLHVPSRRYWQQQPAAYMSPLCVRIAAAAAPCVMSVPPPPHGWMDAHDNCTNLHASCVTATLACRWNCVEFATRHNMWARPTTTSMFATMPNETLTTQQTAASV